MRIPNEYFVGDLVEITLFDIFRDYPEALYEILEKVFEIECAIAGYQYDAEELSYFVEVELVEVEDSRDVLDLCIERFEDNGNDGIRKHMESMFENLVGTKRLLLLPSTAILGPVLEDEEEEDLEDEELEEEE